MLYSQTSLNDADRSCIPYGLLLEFQSLKAESFPWVTCIVQQNVNDVYLNSYKINIKGCFSFDRAI